MPQLTQAEMVDGLKLGLFSRIVGTDVLLDSLSRVGRFTNASLLAVTHQVILKIEAAGIALTPDPITGRTNEHAADETAYAHDCETLRQWMDQLIEVTSPLRLWYELGARGAEYVMGQTQGTTEPPRKSGSNSKGLGQPSSHFKGARPKFEMLFAQLDEQRRSPGEVLQMVAKDFPCLLSLKSLIEKTDESRNIGAERNCAHLLKLAEQSFGELTDLEKSVITVLASAPSSIRREVLYDLVMLELKAKKHPTIADSTFNTRMPELGRRGIVVSTRKKPFGYSLSQWSIPDSR